MAEELDYMSDEFLTNCSNTKCDVRPGLLKTHNEQRQHDLIKKRKLDLENNNKKQSNESPLDVLEEALKQPITSSNKGFSMLEKMGFKCGMGLGKNKTGIVEPIPINIKNDRQGLGLRKKSKKLTNQKKEIDESLLQKTEADYRAFLSKKNKERETSRDLRMSQKICKELDEKANRREPDELWFWPDDKPSETDEVDKLNSEENEQESEYLISDEEKVEKLVKYLRDVYFYCIWCKIQYEDEEDLKDCPGMTREDH